MKVGDWVKPIEGHQIHCSTYIYDKAMVLRMKPFILVSKDTGMRWSCEKPKNFVVIGRASIKQYLKAALKRWKD